MNNGYSDSEFEDDAQKRNDREIDTKRRDEITITSESIQIAIKLKKRINMQCEVKKFSRGTDVSINNWIVQMESYVETSKFS